MENPELNDLADQVARNFQVLMNACNHEAPVHLLSMLSMRLAKSARKLSQEAEKAPPGTSVRMDPTIPEALAEFHAQAFTGHKSGTLPDTFPEDWLDG